MTQDLEHEDTPSSVKVVDRRWWVQQGETAETAGTRAEEGWQAGKPTYVEELEQRLAEKDRQLQDTLSRYREAAREFDEMRARVRKDVARDVERGRRAMLSDMLEVLDNLDRALDASAAAPSPLVSGVEMVRRLFLAKLEGYGVKRIDAIGFPFDPVLHEAVTMVPTADPAADGRVCGVLAYGYTINDELLRPARVAVARASDSDAAE